MVTIVEVDESSAAAEAGIVVGEKILRVNGEVVKDFLDFHFAVAEEIIEIETLASGDSGPRVYRIRREPGRALGLRVDEGPVRRCTNKCIFCFVDQLPRDLRRSLYVKDGDYRYSFLHGNYITGSNLSERHIARITRMGLSPLYISVHATDPVVRARLLGRCGELDVMPLVGRLVDQGIELHFQVVLCPGINDGPVLDKTINQLEALGPGALSLAVVPVGLTAHREELTRLKPVTREDAARALRLINHRQSQFRRKRGSRFVFAADEFYLKAGWRIPPHAAYEGFPQLENGVGLIRREINAVRRAVENRDIRQLEPGRYYKVVTGTLFQPVLRELLSEFTVVVPGRFEVVAVKNRLLGESITVAGLLAGGDILETMKNTPPADVYLIPAAALNADSLFLDDMPLAELKQALLPGEVVVASDLHQALTELAALSEATDKDIR
jgi:putative radical SAM enzyme (TIGR03279 family)